MLESDGLKLYLDSIYTLSGTSAIIQGFVGVSRKRVKPSCRPSLSEIATSGLLTSNKNS
ncbi:hypothetical protein [Pontibacter anaerobius]|uniref:Uncharacterized protein n=1 Tax=Pontibacter anaerobius TaxID=2993940 RepID=A0ABT3RFB3_9BACT|nr:hypothetical protein [Pontibacter anaerobius]MCX2740121.1 hypothetical protein [Pontibacter anaerobius]